MALSQEQIERLDAKKAGQGFTPKQKNDRTPPRQHQEANPQALSPIGAGLGTMVRGLEAAEDNAAEALADRLEQSPAIIMAKAMEKLHDRGWNPEATFCEFNAEIAQIPQALPRRDMYQLKPCEVTNG